MEIVNMFMPFNTYTTDSRRYSTHSKFSAENCTAVLLQQQQQQQQQHQQQQQIIDQNMIESQNIDDLFDFSNEEISSVLGAEEATAAAEEEEEESVEEEEEAAGLGSVSNSDQNRININNNNNHTNNIGPLLQQQLNDDDLFPSCEDRAELEWLSNFVDESMSSSAAALDGASPLFGCRTVGGSNSSSNNHNSSPVDRQKSAGSESKEGEALILSPGYGYHRDSCTVYREKDSVELSAGAGAGVGTGPDASLVRTGGGRPRSKRVRTTTGLLSRVWESRVILIDYRNARPSPAENALIESPPSTSTLTDLEDGQVLDYFPYSAAPSLLPPPPPPSGHKKQQKAVVAAVTAATPKKKKKKPALASVLNTNTNTAMTTSASLSSSSSEVKGGVEVDLSPATARKCLHCATTKTPQWRAGPQGPKTLCNACGVRFKSGRLLPEYRPAASPTFVECLHSNSHRRVLEMRKQKDGPNDGYGYDEGDTDADADVDYNDDDNDSCRTTITTTITHSSWDTP